MMSCERDYSEAIKCADVRRILDLSFIQFSAMAEKYKIEIITNPNGGDTYISLEDFGLLCDYADGDEAMTNKCQTPMIERKKAIRLCKDGLPARKQTEFTPHFEHEVRGEDGKIYVPVAEVEAICERKKQFCGEPIKSEKNICKNLEISVEKWREIAEKYVFGYVEVEGERYYFGRDMWIIAEITGDTLDGADEYFRHVLARTIGEAKRLNENAERTSGAGAAAILRP